MPHRSQTTASAFKRAPQAGQTDVVSDMVEGCMVIETFFLNAARPLEFGQKNPSRCIFQKPDPL